MYKLILAAVIGATVVSQSAMAVTEHGYQILSPSETAAQGVEFQRLSTNVKTVKDVQATSIAGKQYGYEDQTMTLSGQHYLHIHNATDVKQTYHVTFEMQSYWGTTGRSLDYVVEPNATVDDAYVSKLTFKPNCNNSSNFWVRTRISGESSDYSEAINRVIIY